jgi:hypothetical protein
MDDLRDIGLSDFVRFEKVRRNFPDVAEQFNLVTNSSSGVYQIDPIVAVHEVLPGNFSSISANDFRSISVSGSPGDDAEFDTPVPATDTELDSATWILGATITYRDSGVGQFTLVAPDPASFSIGTASVEVSSPGSGFGRLQGRVQGSPSIPIGVNLELEEFSALRARVLPPGLVALVGFINRSGAAQDVDIDVLYVNQPPGLTYTNNGIA